MKKLKDLCRRHKINYDQALRMIAYHHGFETLLNPKDLESVEIDISADSLKIVQRAAKGLRISEDAVICSILADAMEAE